MTKRLQKILCVLFAMTIFFASTVQVWADTIEELRNRVQQNQAELNNITGQISGLEDEQDLIEEVIQDLEQGKEVEPIQYVEESVFTYKNAAKYISGRKY